MNSIIVLNKKLKDAWIEDINNGKLKERNIDKIEEYIELIIKSINMKNSKYGITDIVFSETPVDGINNAIYTGRITDSNDFSVSHAYVFITKPYLGSRNIFGSQHLFPGLSKLVEQNLKSPTYDMVNLPIYFINASIDEVAPSMEQTVVAMTLMDVRYIPLFDTNISSTFMKNSYNLEGYSKIISKNSNSSIIDTDCYELDFNKKNLVFKTNMLKKETFGSSDRFFVIKAYPALLLAETEGYFVDISEVEDFLLKEKLGTSNLKPFIDFAKKNIERSKY